MEPMCRNLTHLLICLTMSLTLAVSGGAAATQLTMALVAASGTEVVICADGQAKTIVLNAAGEPIAPMSKDCAKCPDCRQVVTLAVPPAVVGAAKAQSLPVETRDAPARFASRLVRGPQLPRAPPKGI